MTILFLGKLLVAKRRSADRVVKRAQQCRPFVDEFRMGHRANGVDDLPALGKRDGNFAFFKWKVYGRHHHYHFREGATIGKCLSMRPLDIGTDRYDPLARSSSA